MRELNEDELNVVAGGAKGGWFNAGTVLAGIFGVILYGGVALSALFAFIMGNFNKGQD